MMLTVKRPANLLSEIQLALIVGKKNAHARKILVHRDLRVIEPPFQDINIFSTAVYFFLRSPTVLLMTSIHSE